MSTDNGGLLEKLIRFAIAHRWLMLVLTLALVGVGAWSATKLPIVMWQIPLGNRHLPNTNRRYRDTHVATLLGSRRTLRAYRDAGVVALLFGGGADGTTSERTDRGVFRRLAGRYVHAGTLRTRR